MAVDDHFSQFPFPIGAFTVLWLTNGVFLHRLHMHDLLINRKEKGQQ